MTSVPLLSVIGWVRNDGYMEGYVGRTLRALRFLVDQLNRYKVSAEIVLVEWNPPKDRPLMGELLSDIGDSGHVTIRVIVVDQAFHTPLIGSNLKGMHASNAANAGIWRARGRFLVPKAVDTFLTDRVIEHIANDLLKEDEVYRCDRFDVKMPRADWVDLPDDELMALMPDNIVLHHDRIVQTPAWRLRDLHTNACGDFTLMAAARWREIRGYPNDPTVLCLDADSIAFHAAAAQGVREVCWGGDARVYKVVHGNTLAHRLAEDWKNWQKWLDTVAEQKLSPDVRVGLRILLDYPRRRVRGIDGIRAPSIERNFVAKARRYARYDTALVTNTENWGLAGEVLPELKPVRGVWDHQEA